MTTINAAIWRWGLAKIAKAGLNAEETGERLSDAAFPHHINSECWRSCLTPGNDLLAVSGSISFWSPCLAWYGSRSYTADKKKKSSVSTLAQVMQED